RFVRAENGAEGQKSGAAGDLAYPLEPRELIANVQALLRVRQAEREARAGRELLRVTLGSIGDGVVATDLAGVVTFINPVAQSLTGWGEEAGGRALPEGFRIINGKTGAPAENPLDKMIPTRTAGGTANHTAQMARARSG